MTPSERADDEPTTPREPTPPPPAEAEDSPTTELSAADPDATQEWRAPDADEATREHGMVDDDATREQPALGDEPVLGADATREGPALGDPADALAAQDDETERIRLEQEDDPASAGAPGTDVAAATPPGPPAVPDREALRDWPAGDTRETRIVSPAERDRQPDPLPPSEFPVVWRGYDVHEVDAYVAAAEAAIAAFEERTLPTVAVQRALDRVGEQTASILREAEQAAEETARTSRAQADDRLQRAEREAAETIEAAERRVRDLDDDIERLWQERQRLIDATRDIADRLRLAADDAESRFPPAAPPPPPFDGADDAPIGEADVVADPDVEPDPERGI